MNPSTVALYLRRAGIISYPDHTAAGVLPALITTLLIGDVDHDDPIIRQRPACSPVATCNPSPGSDAGERHRSRPVGRTRTWSLSPTRICAGSRAFRHPGTQSLHTLWYTLRKHSASLERQQLLAYTNNKTSKSRRHLISTRQPALSRFISRHHSVGALSDKIETSLHTCKKG
jgi:hypothetical protein